MRIVVIGTPGLGAALAERLHLEHIQRPEEVHADAFVLDGSPRDLAEARALDAMLRARAAEVDAVLLVRGGAVDEAVLDHYLGRVIELEAADAFESALDHLREVLLAA
jgi:adenylate kinase family enzyme